MILLCFEDENETNTEPKTSFPLYSTETLKDQACIRGGEQSGFPTNEPASDALFMVVTCVYKFEGACFTARATCIVICIKRNPLRASHNFCSSEW